MLKPWYEYRGRFYGNRYEGPSRAILNDASKDFLSPEGNLTCAFLDIETLFPIPTVKICKAMGIEFKDFTTSGIQDPDAVSHCYHDGKGVAWIALNPECPLLLRRWAVAHCLGHILLHPTGTYRDLIQYPEKPKSGSQDYEANRFAAAYLMPKRAITSVFNMAKFYTEQMAEMFFVSRGAIAERIFEIGLVARPPSVEDILAMYGLR